MRANRQFEGRVSGQLGSAFLAQLLRRMNSASPSAVRTPSQELFLIWCWPRCRGLCYCFQKGVLLCFGLFFPQQIVADLPRKSHPFQLFSGHA
jgi:hypothetical protein